MARWMRLALDGRLVAALGAPKLTRDEYCVTTADVLSVHENGCPASLAGVGDCGKRPSV